MTAKPLCERERQLAKLREAYAKAAAGPIKSALGTYSLSLLAMLITLLETDGDERSRETVGVARSTPRLDP